MEESPQVDGGDSLGVRPCLNLLQAKRSYRKPSFFSEDFCAGSVASARFARGAPGKALEGQTRAPGIRFFRKMIVTMYRIEISGGTSLLYKVVPRGYLAVRKIETPS